MPPGPPGDILDVGCGSGAFLLGLREAGWRAHGVELDPGAVEAARKAGLEDVRVGDLIEEAYPDASFDAVRFWHCLEHVGDPGAQLREALRVLRPGGSLTVGVPNFGSLLARAAKDDWFYLDVPRHLWHFEPRTLRELARDCGFSAVRVRIRTAGSPLLGTIDFAVGRGERLLDSRAAYFAALPIAALLDTVQLGDALELTARRPS
jgi:SAM-dependent methyltransferase